MNHKSLLFLNACLLLCSISFSQTPDLIPFLYGNKWGYTDQQMNVIIPPSYEEAKPFENGLARVRRNFHWAVIDRSGRPLCDFKYHSIEDLVNTTARVKINGMHGYINNRGQEIIPVIFNETFNYKDIVVVKKEYSYGLFDTLGKELLPVEYQLIAEPHGDVVLIKKDDKFGFTDRKGNMIIPPSYESLWYPVNGVSFYLMDKKYGYVDSTGKMITPAVYDNIWGFSNGFAQVKKDNKMGIIDRQGEEVIPPVYDYVHVFSEGKVIVGNNNLYGFCNEMGEIIIPIEYMGAWPFMEGRAKAMKDGKWGFIGSDGKNITPFQYDETGSFSNGLAWVMQDSLCGYVDQSGQIAIPLVFEAAQNFDEGLAVCRSMGKYGVIDTTGQFVIPPAYDTVYFSENGRISIQTPEGTGCTNRQGKIIIPPVYLYYTEFIGDLFQVGQGDMVGLVDSAGTVVLPIEYAYFDAVEGYPLAKIQKDDLYGLIDENGKIIIPCRYEWLDMDETGLLLAAENDKYGFLDTNGNPVIPLDFLNVYKFRYGLTLTRISYTLPDVYADISGQVYYKPFTEELKEPKLPEVKMRDTEVHSITSNANGRTYKIHVFLPLNYYKSNKTYPVLYLPDADAVQGIVSESVFMAAFEQKIPEMIIVGISYETTFEDYYAKRIYDLTPTDDKDNQAYPGGGGSGLFHRFIKEELIPFIESRYRIMENERVLTGYSLSGLFAAQVLFHDPSLFQRYIMVSPSLWWDDLIALSWESTYYDQHQELNATVYMSLSSFEWGAVEDMNKTILSRKYRSLNYTYEKIAEESHFTTFPAAFVKGIKKVFALERDGNMF